MKKILENVQSKNPLIKHELDNTSLKTDASADHVTLELQRSFFIIGSSGLLAFDFDLYKWKLEKKFQLLIIVKSNPSLPQSRPDDYLARFCQNLAKNCLSCKIWQKNGYLARSARKMVILQDLPEKWLSCKILASSFRSSCPLIGSHSCNKFHFDQKFTSESVACFLRKIINLNRF